MNSMIQMDSEIQDVNMNFSFLIFIIEIVLNNLHVPRGLRVGKSNIWRLLSLKLCTRHLF